MTVTFYKYISCRW